MKSHKKCEHVASFSVEEKLIVIWAYFHNWSISIDALDGRPPDKDMIDHLFRGVKGCRETMKDVIERHRREMCKECAHSNATFDEILDCYKKGKDKKMPHGHKTGEA